MADGPELRVLEYGHEPPRIDPKRRRVLYCIGLPLIAFALCGGVGFRLGNGVVAAAGALLIAMALPIRD